MNYFSKNIIRCDKGAVQAEYGLLAFLIAVVAILAVAFLGESVLALFERVESNTF